MADEPSPEELSAQLAALDVAQFVAAAASTIASLAYAKLEAGDLDQARRAIDALVALCPHVGGDLKPDLERTVTSLQVAYASRAST